MSVTFNEEECKRFIEAIRDFSIVLGKQKNYILTILWMV